MSETAWKLLGLTNWKFMQSISVLISFSLCHKIFFSLLTGFLISWLSLNSLIPYDPVSWWAYKRKGVLIMYAQCRQEKGNLVLGGRIGASGRRNTGPGLRSSKNFVLWTVSLVYCRRIGLIGYVIWLCRVSIIQTANFLLSLDILPRNYRYLWSQEHATLYLLYSCTQVRHARQKTNCLCNLCKAERQEGRELNWRLDEAEFSNRTILLSQSKGPWSQYFALGSGQMRCWRKKNQSSMLISTFPSQFSPSLSTDWGRAKLSGA